MRESAFTSCGHTASLAFATLCTQAAVSNRSKTVILLDHLVSSCEQRRGNGNAKHSRGLSVYDELELARLNDRQISRFCPLEDATYIDADLTQSIWKVDDVA
jgi:hypothetical protein